ncbi:MAG: acyl-ACP--UDP-N-acetylglucosamine O-acyltransferase [Acidobacteriota bacterium]
MSTTIHPTAVVDAKAELGQDVVVGPLSVIEAGVRVGDRCLIGPLNRLTGDTTIGSDNRFESHGSIGAPPQDLKYAGEPTRLEIGDNNVFRECVTIHRGTPGGGGLTTLGNDGLFMAYVHIAHDCHVGSQVIFANNATLAGHVDVGDGSTVGALTAVHQFCRVGEHAFIGGGSIVTKDSMPFMKIVGNRPARCFGPNTIGLERKGFAEDRRKALTAMWRILRSPKLNTSQAVAKIKDELAGHEDVDRVLEFIESSPRGVILARG